MMSYSRTTEVDKLLDRHSGKQGNKRAKKRRLVFQLLYHISRIFNRLVELCLSLVVIVFLTLPCHLFFLMRKLFTGKDMLSPRTISGKDAKKTTISYFNGSTPFTRNLFLFYYVITGQLALVGTAITEWDDRLASLKQAYISTIKPGIFSLTYVRQASKIAHEGHESIEWEYVFKKNPLFDFLLLLRTVPALFFQSKEEKHDDTLNLFDLEIANMTMAGAIGDIKGAVTDGRGKSVFFVNPDCLNKIFRDREYFQVLQAGDLVLPDGIGLTVAGNMLQTPLKENVNGTDMLPFLCEMAARENFSLFLLGGRPGVAADMAGKLAEQFKVKIAGTENGYFDREKEKDHIIETINQTGAEILLVAFGAPLQEKWISENRSALNAKVMMGVGGLFDFYSGNTRRAPRWLREIGLEWLYRMLQEPGRMWKRYVIGNPLFLYRVMRWKVYSGAGNREDMS